MKQMIKIDTVDDYNNITDHQTFHPLVSVINFSNTKPKGKRTVDSLNFGFYAIFLKEDNVKCNLRYGRNKYDYQKGTLVFIAPGQVVSIEEDGDNYQPEGYALIFHPDLIHRSSLAQKIKEYSFFSYDVHEALHLSEYEKQIVIDCLKKIEFELKHTVDKHSNNLIVSNIELFLGYCLRFYDRQFITRDIAHKGILEKFESLLNDYFQSASLETDGSPSVAYCAQHLNLSANYFGDLIKKETGKTAQDYIHMKLLDLAKEKIFSTNKSLSEISFELGFKYPQHFSRFFKQHVGMSPNEYRLMN